MQKVIRFQAVLFGTFNFPADPDTTVKLMTTFAPLGFMPQVMTVPDPMTRLMSQRIGLTKGTDAQILFAPDRIDFTTMMPTGSIEEFMSDVVTNVKQLEHGNLRFNRVALVVDTLHEEMSHTDSETLRNKLLPKSGGNSIEWIARWVTPLSTDTEQYNVCFEAMNAIGLMMVHNGLMQPLNGIKVMSDVSTAPSNTNHRFDANNLHEALNAISKIISDQADLVQA
jgi:hypothetical protein